ncbi:MAG: hypothetical protein HY275_02460 [Gemmatimonadetes bacterium]|nr:hypothetical protein [Gemmatimonadota bacterium]
MTAPAIPDPAVLARIGDLELVARWVVEGFLSGLHSARHLPHLLHVLARAIAAGKGNLAGAVAQVAARQRRRGFFMLVSDLYEPATDVVNAIAPLTGAGHDVIVVQVLDPAERTFPFEDATTFRDLESGARMPVTPGKVRTAYRARMGAHLEAMRARLTAHRADYLLADTSEPLDRVLFDYLLRREFLRTAN